LLTAWLAIVPLPPLAEKDTVAFGSVTVKWTFKQEPYLLASAVTSKRYFPAASDSSGIDWYIELDLSNTYTFEFGLMVLLPKIGELPSLPVSS
jgi:hypothetical protein